jgi:hypothetical protein
MTLQKSENVKTKFTMLFVLNLLFYKCLGGH